MGSIPIYFIGGTALAILLAIIVHGILSIILKRKIKEERLMTDKFSFISIIITFTTNLIAGSLLA